MEPEIRRVVVGPIGTCCYVLSLPGRTDCAVIDPGGEAERVRDATQGRQIAAILLTHGHFDHIGAVKALMSQTTALLVHEADAPLLCDPEQNASWLVGEAVTAPAPTRLLTDGDEIDCAGLRLTVLHTPGHTQGSVCYRLADALFTGDTLFAGGGYGRTDLPGGSAASLRASLRRLLPVAAACAVYPGHGG